MLWRLLVGVLTKTTATTATTNLNPDTQLKGWAEGASPCWLAFYFIALGGERL
jgi:hypothetical protein